MFGNVVFGYYMKVERLEFLLHFGIFCQKTKHLLLTKNFKNLIAKIFKKCANTTNYENV